MSKQTRIHAASFSKAVTFTAQVHMDLLRSKSHCGTCSQVSKYRISASVNLKLWGLINRLGKWPQIMHIIWVCLSCHRLGLASSPILSCNHQEEAENSQVLSCGLHRGRYRQAGRETDRQTVWLILIMLSALLKCTKKASLDTKF